MPQSRQRSALREPITRDAFAKASGFDFKKTFELAITSLTAGLETGTARLG